MLISIDKKHKEVELTLTGSPECVDRVLALLAMIQANGENGSSGIYGISWDGDGKDKIAIKGIEPYCKINNDGINACSNYGGVVEFVGENNKFFTISAGSNDYSIKRVYPKE